MTHLAELEKQKKFIFDFDLTVVLNKFSKEQGVDEGGLKLFEQEFKKFMLLRVSQKRKYGIMGKQDELWHIFILHTKLYTEFCDGAFGKYLHHNPAEGDDPTNPMESFAYIRFLVDYFRFYGECPPKDIWPFSFELFGDVNEWEIEPEACVAPCHV